LTSLIGKVMARLQACPARLWRQRPSHGLAQELVDTPAQKLGLPAQKPAAFDHFIDALRPAPRHRLEGGLGRESRRGNPQLPGHARALAAQRVEPLQKLGARPLAWFAPSQFGPFHPAEPRRARDRLLERREQRAANISRQLESRLQRRFRVRLRPRDQLEYLLIAENLESRPVGAARMPIAPLPDLAQIGELAAGEPPRPGDAPGILGIAQLVTAARLHHRPAAFRMPFEAALLAQLAGETFRQWREKARVIGRVAE